MPISGRQADAQGTSAEDAQGTSSCGTDGGAGVMGGHGNIRAIRNNELDRRRRWVRRRPKNFDQVKPPEGWGNGHTRSPSPSFIGQVRILGVLEKLPIQLRVHLVVHETRCAKVHHSHR